MLQVLGILLDGLLLRCPRCPWGRMFSGFRMHHTCPVCALEFERASGETTGGMGINVTATCVVESLAAVGLIAAPAVPVPVAVLVLVMVGTLFPIAFYRSSRGLWAAFLFLTGNNSEPD
jgi:uncharacterized protein (DUF983 family)